MRLQMHTHSPTAEQKRRSAPRGIRGFAMMDAAIGATMLGIIIVGTLQLFEFGQRQILIRAQERSAHDLAQNRIEEVIADGFLDAVAQTDSNLTVFGGVEATRITTISYIDDPADGLGADDENGTQDFKDVQVEVIYGNNRSLTLNTILIP